jgi:replicative DNA helicase
MTPDEYRNRTYAMMNPGKFSINDMLAGDVNVDDMREWGTKYFSDKKGFIVPSMSGTLTVTPNMVGAKIDQHKPDMVVLDYAQLLMDNANSQDMTKRMLNLTNELKALAQAKNVPIILISSVTDEAGDKRDTAPLLKQVAWSRGIEYNANLAVAIHKHAGAEGGQPVVEYACRKNRNGEEFNFGLRADVDKGIFVEDFDF